MSAPRVASRRAGRAGLALAVVLCVAVLAGPAVVPHDPTSLDLPAKLAGPSGEHWLGTDQFGRDQLARLLDGGRRSLGAAVVVLVAAVSLGMLVGLAAGCASAGGTRRRRDGRLGRLRPSGTYGSLADRVVMRVVDVVLAFPPLVLALAVVGALGPGFGHLLLALTLSSWAYYARLTRMLAWSARNRPDVVAARLAGIGWRRSVAGHVLPGVAAQLGAVATLNLGEVVLSLAALSFLGLGAQPPDAEWGAMLTDSRLYLGTAPWLLAGPAVAIFAAVLAANLMGDALRDSIDPALGSA